MLNYSKKTKKTKTWTNSNFNLNDRKTVKA